MTLDHHYFAQTTSHHLDLHILQKTGKHRNYTNKTLLPPAIDLPAAVESLRLSQAEDQTHSYCSPIFLLLRERPRANLPVGRWAIRALILGSQPPALRPFICYYERQAFDAHWEACTPEARTAMEADGILPSWLVEDRHGICASRSGGAPFQGPSRHAQKIIRRTVYKRAVAVGERVTSRRRLTVEGRRRLMRELEPEVMRRWAEVVRRRRERVDRKGLWEKGAEKRREREQARRDVFEGGDEAFSLEEALTLH